MVCNLCNFKSTLIDMLSPNALIVQKIFSWYADVCVCWNNKDGKWVDKQSSCTALAYHNVDGISLSLHIAKECSKCHDVYEYGLRRNTNGSISFYNINKLQFYQYSKCNFFNNVFFNDVANYVLGQGVSFQSKAKYENEKNSEIILDIENRMKEISMFLF